MVCLAGQHALLGSLQAHIEQRQAQIEQRLAGVLQQPVQMQHWQMQNALHAWATDQLRAQVQMLNLSSQLRPRVISHEGCTARARVSATSDVQEGLIRAYIRDTADDNGQGLQCIAALAAQPNHCGSTPLQEGMEEVEAIKISSGGSMQCRMQFHNACMHVRTSQNC